MKDKGKVLVGMSGGVDSAVTALLLKERGYEVVGATFRLWSPEMLEASEDSGCCSADDVHDARKTCDFLGIPHYVMNFKELFRTAVVDDFVAQYDLGRTPNPCVRCNRYIKFPAFWKKAQACGFDFIATGHYATVSRDASTGLYRLGKGVQLAKDQSYVLYSLTQELLSHLLLPLGDLSKDQVRELAREAGLPVSSKPDSQDICFVPDGDYAGFLRAYTGRTCPPGDFVDEQGNVLAKHKGIWHYTIGQRKGLGVSFGRPVFVSAIDPLANRVTVGEETAIFHNRMVVEEANLIDPESFKEPRELSVKIRYAHNPAPATLISLPDGAIEVIFHQPQRAVTPGQAAVFYDGSYVVGGGTISQQQRRG